MGREPATGRGNPGRGHGNGRIGGRPFNGSANRNSNSSGNTSSVSASKATLDPKFTLKTDGKVQATYASVVQRITNFIQRDFDEGSEVAESLNELSLYIIPIPTVATADEDDPIAAAATQRMYDMISQEEAKSYTASKKLLVSNMKKAYALIYDVYCSKPMQGRIDEMKAIDSSITNDPIKLLQTIRTLMHENVRSKYPVASLIDTMISLLTIAQRENESATEYYKRFKELNDMFKQTMGKQWMAEWVTTIPDYADCSVADQEIMKRSAVSLLESYVLIKGARSDKYDSLVRDLNAQYTRGNNQWPTTHKLAADLVVKYGT